MKFCKKIFLFKTFLIPIIVAISCQNQPPRLVVTFPDTLKNGNNINFDNLKAKNMKNVTLQISETKKAAIKDFINSDNKSFEKALTMVKNGIVFSGTIIITHTGHNHEVFLNNILLSTNYGNFFLKLEAFANGAIFQVQDDKIIFNFKLASSNNLFSYIYNAKV